MLRLYTFVGLDQNPRTAIAEATDQANEFLSRRPDASGAKNFVQLIITTAETPESSSYAPSTTHCITVLVQETQ